MSDYIRRVKYYETDRMGITHHSNYVRWFEEARMEYLKNIGYSMCWIESKGFTSPVLSLTCNYKRTTTYDDEIRISLKVKNYTGAKLEFECVMTDNVTGEVVCTGESSHCYIDSSGKPVSVRKYLPELDAVLRESVGK